MSFSRMLGVGSGMGCSGPAGPCHRVAAVFQAQGGLLSGQLYYQISWFPPRKTRLAFPFPLGWEGQQWAGGEVTGTQRDSFVLWETLREEAGWSPRSVELSASQNHHAAQGC